MESFSNPRRKFEIRRALPLLPVVATLGVLFLIESGLAAE